MEAKKSNQISIKLNGSHLPKKPQQESKPTKTAFSHTAHVEEPQILPFAPLRTEEAVELPVETTQSDQSATDDDALARLNQLRYKEQGVSSEQSDLIIREDEQPNEMKVYEQEYSGPIIELEESDRQSTGRRVSSFALKNLFTGNTIHPLMRAPWFRVMLSTLGAVSLGLIFGFVVLMIFKQDQMAQSYKTVLGGTLQLPTAQSQVGGNAPNAAQNQSGTANATQVPGNPSVTSHDAAQAKDAVQTVLSVPEQNLFLAQAGVFSDVSSAQPVVDPLTKQGYPHFFYEMEGKEHLFVAMAPTRDEILGIASFLKKNQMDIYVKEITLASLEKDVMLPKSLLNADPTMTDKNLLEGFLTSGFEVVKSLSTYSSRVLNQETTAEPIKADEENRMRELHRQFVDQARLVQSEVPLDWQPYMKGMVDGLNQAVSAMNGLKSSNAQPYAWQVQSGAFQYLTNYIEWSTKLNAPM